MTDTMILAREVCDTREEANAKIPWCYTQLFRWMMRRREVIVLERFNVSVWEDDERWLSDVWIVCKGRVNPYER